MEAHPRVVLNAPLKLVPIQNSKFSRPARVILQLFVNNLWDVLEPCTVWLSEVEARNFGCVKVGLASAGPVISTDALITVVLAVGPTVTYLVQMDATLTICTEEDISSTVTLIVKTFRVAVTLILHRYDTPLSIIESAHASSPIIVEAHGVPVEGSTFQCSMVGR